MDGTCSLKILASTILLAVLGGMIAYCINLPFKREKINLIATSISAIENILLNMWFIPKFGINGAAFTTFLSEFTVLLIEIVSIKSYYKLFYKKVIIVNTIKCIISSISIIIVAKIFDNLFTIYSFSYLICTFITSIVMYFSFNLALKNEIVINLFENLIKKINIKNRRKK